MYLPSKNDISTPFYQLFYLQSLYNISEVEVSSNIYERYKQKIMTEHLRGSNCTSIDTFLLISAGSGIVIVI